MSLFLQPHNSNNKNHIMWVHGIHQNLFHLTLSGNDLHCNELYWMLRQSFEFALKSVEVAQRESDTHGLALVHKVLLHLQSCKTSVGEMYMQHNWQQKGRINNENILISIRLHLALMTGFRHALHYFCKSIIQGQMGSRMFQNL